MVQYFYPRSPCGERLALFRTLYRTLCISIHVPLAGNVDGRGRADGVGEIISIHVPLAGNVNIDPQFKRNADISIHVPLAGNVVS